MKQKYVTNYNFDRIEHDTESGVYLIKSRDIGSDDIKDLLRRTRVRFIVAVIGLPLKWIPNTEAFEFWKDEVKIRLIEPMQAEKGFYPEEYPAEYCYLASEWKDGWKEDLENSYILLTMYD